MQTYHYLQWFIIVWLAHFTRVRARETLYAVFINRPVFVLTLRVIRFLINYRQRQDRNPGSSCSFYCCCSSPKTSANIWSHDSLTETVWAWSPQREPGDPRRLWMFSVRTVAVTGTLEQSQPLGWNHMSVLWKDRTRGMCKQRRWMEGDRWRRREDWGANKCVTAETNPHAAPTAVVNPQLTEIPWSAPSCLSVSDCLFLSLAPSHTHTHSLF